MGPELSLLMLFLSFILSYFLCGRLLILLERKNVISIPNHRSNHTNPTPIGGGIAIIISFFIGCLPLAIFHATLKPPLFIFSALTLLSVISFRDDISHIPAPLRLIAHFIAAIIGAFIVQHNGLIFNGIIDKEVEYILIVIAIVTFMNLFNFMDGIDGMTGMETIHLGIAIAIVLYMLNNQSSYIYISLLLVSCSLGFIIYNWHPAKMFMGDAGSITIGYILALMLLIIAAKGAWVQAIILPLYYFSDAGFILIKRMIKLEKVWEAHSEHFFQLAVRKGISHSEVVLKIAILNILLLTLSLFALKFPGDFLKECSILLIGIVFTILTIKLLSVKMPILDLKARRSNINSQL